MHIAIDCRFVHHSGIGRYAREIVPRLVQGAAHRYTLVVSPAERDEAFLASCSLPHTAFRSCAAPMYSLREQVSLPQAVPSCDVFWALHYNAPIFLPQARKRMATVHDMAHLAFQEQLSLPKRLYARLLMYTTCHFYDKILTVSAFSKGEILRYEGIPAQKVAVCPCAVDRARFEAPIPEGRMQAVREKYRLPLRYFLYVGNAKPNKNLARLLQAYGLFRRRNSPAPPALAIAGKREGFHTGEDGLAELAGRICPAGSVRFTGHVAEEDLPCLYRMAQGFLFPSLYEGFGIPPLEAMASGCPVMASRSASLPEVCGDGAVYADAMDPASMADAMEALAGPGREELVRRGRRRAAAFDWDRTARAIEELFSEWERGS